MQTTVRRQCALLWEPRIRYVPLVHRRHLKKLHPKDQKSKYDRKVEASLEEWERGAEKVRSGECSSMLSTLETRGYVNAIAGDRNELDKALTDHRLAAYVGVDPTAPSLHVGHLLPMMALLWMFIHGYEVIVLLGGATAAIGDPSGRQSSRQPMSSDVRRANMAAMHLQLKRLWKKMEEHATQRHGFKSEWGWRRNLWNNNEWLSKVSVYEFMTQIGNGIRVGPLLGRDNVKTKMESGDGISFSELAYPLLQAWDWWQMYQRKGVCIQIGGADQFGNIISGIDSMNYLQKKRFARNLAPEYKDRKFFGLTVPLLTTSSGEKFGKSAGNAIWLDEDLTSAMDLYQFLLRSADADIERYLQLFTLLSLSEIKSLMAVHDEDRSKRLPQRKLAQELVAMVHGVARVKEVEAQLGVLYSDHRSNPQNAEGSNPGVVDQVPKEHPVTAFNAGSTQSFLPRSAVFDRPFSSVLYAAGLARSRKEANRLIVAGGAYVGSQPGTKGGWKGGMTESLKFTPILPWTKDHTQMFVIDDSLLILRVGKWKVKIIHLLPDEEYLQKALPLPPGWESPATKPQGGSEATTRSA